MTVLCPREHAPNNTILKQQKFSQVTYVMNYND